MANKLTGKEVCCERTVIYLLSLELNGTTWIPSGPPPFDTSTGLSRSLWDNQEGQINNNKKRATKDSRNKWDNTAVLLGGRLKRLAVVHFD